MKCTKAGFILICLFSLLISYYGVRGCPNVCVCRGKGINTTVSCRFVNGNYTSVRLPNETRDLDLSNCGLDHVPSELFVGLNKLTALSLSKNKITLIQRDAFANLTNLQFLDISYNPNASWEGEIKPNDFPSLTAVDIINSSNLLVEQLNTITSLKAIIGVTWDRNCQNCNLTRFNQTYKGPIPPNCNQPAKYFFMGLLTSCHNIEQCAHHCEGDTSNEEHGRQARRTSVERRRYFFTGYALGVLAILTNIVILVNVLLSSSLRREMSMVLVLNMSVCDIMIGVYALVISNSNIYDMAASVDWSKNITVISSFPYCQVASVLMTTGEIVSVTASLLLTVEKYTFIVYCMNPDVRLKKIHVIVVMVTIWLGSLLFSLSPLYQYFQLKYSPSLMCTMPTNHDSARPTFIIYPCAMITLNYLLMVPMYIHIFIVVNQSGHDVSIHRNAALAKKVFAMIGTNFIFFAIPMILLVVYVFVYQGHVQSSLDQPLSLFIVFEWLPVMLLALNSSLNPFLYAFRYRKFQREFHASVHRLCGCRLRIKLSRALTTIANKRMLYATSTSRMDVNQADSNRDDAMAMTNHIRLGVADPHDSGVVLRHINVNINISNT